MGISEHISLTNIDKNRIYSGTGGCSFICNDENLNFVWQSATSSCGIALQSAILHKNHAKILAYSSAAQYVGVDADIIKYGLDMLKNNAICPQMIGGSAIYTVWWSMLQRELYLNHGDIGYLYSQQKYLRNLTDYFSGRIDANGKIHLPNAFSVDNFPLRYDAAVQSMISIFFNVACELFTYMKDYGYSNLANICLNNINKHIYPCNGDEISEIMHILAYGGGKNSISPNFVSEELSGVNLWWRLSALGEADMINKGLNVILGCVKSDSMIESSLCAVPFIIKYIIGVKIIDKSKHTVLIAPALGALKNAYGSVPVDYGVLKVYNNIDCNGNIDTKYNAPETANIVLG